MTAAADSGRVLPGSERPNSGDDRTDSDASATHEFLLSFDNIMRTYRGRCSCGESFGLTDWVEHLGQEYDDHITAIGWDWFR